MGGSHTLNLAATNHPERYSSIAPNYGGGSFSIILNLSLAILSEMFVPTGLKKRGREKSGNDFDTFF